MRAPAYTAATARGTVSAEPESFVRKRGGGPARRTAGSGKLSLDRIAILSPGDMGHAVGRVLVERGARVVTALAGRSAQTRERARRAGIEDLNSLAAAIEAAELVLSILPPAAARELARAAVPALEQAGHEVLYADCNAVSPATAGSIAAVVQDAGAKFIDVGIVGPAPGRGPDTRFYASGPAAERFRALDAPGVEVRVIGSEVGRASALKMVYAGLTKGTLTLYTAVLVAAERLGLSQELARELSESQATAFDRMRAVPFLPADAGRWIGEMEEIAATFDQAGVTPAFHEAAAWIFRLLERTPYASETRETLDRTRTLEQAVRTFARELGR